MKTNASLTVDNITLPIAGEKNLLELIRKAHIELPTFCYHSEISVYGACRMCMVEVAGRGLLPACSTPPEAGMVVWTQTEQIRKMRRMIIELMLANHDQNCTTCPKSDNCRLQAIAKQLGVREVRFQRTSHEDALDLSSPSIIRDNNKCILCGDCVRVCDEIQSVGALDFANRGAEVKVGPCFNKGLGEVECVNCGQCVQVCPVGALTPKYQVTQVWQALHNPGKTVAVQVAPAVRVALGEAFSLDPGVLTIGQIVTALRLMGFDHVYDTSYGADLTVIEEGREFLKRVQEGGDLPQFTSCCPAWVKFAEQYYPDLLSHLSSCRSPQQMFGSICKDGLTKELGCKREDIVMVSIMPCTAKKFEAGRPEFAVDGNPDVDYVLTTQELVLMIQEMGIQFADLDPDSFDMPYGFKTGAGVIFGNSGGVSEAVLRYVADELCQDKNRRFDFQYIRGEEGVRELELEIAGHQLRLGIVSGLANARQLIDKVRHGEAHYDLIEVMACCGGCVNGGGQPVKEHADTLAKRRKGLYDSDKILQFHKSQQNPYIQQLYAEGLTEEKAHHLLHTQYCNRKRFEGEELLLSQGAPGGPEAQPLEVAICFGTSCFLRGAQTLYTQLVEKLRAEGLTDKVQFSATFCSERCRKGPVVRVGESVLEQCTLDDAYQAICQSLR